ncbi:hypothetical protein MMYC01_207194 [Madurella mycetomatis]|uniref:Berberine/berberine-like domain-containing protein n=1 Tax=Madurella mycetomatis TaxID=100816 RepID=A0A175VYG5_9PEZI|nr:hypothetical protein MMYC01_207459 [Madurella mycetomatis]KXX76040.1 hypothetical protein MMYC01_207194 [Madurella mycetomatis]
MASITLYKLSISSSLSSEVRHPYLSTVSFNVDVGRSGISTPDEFAVNPYFRQPIVNVFLGVAVDFLDWEVNVAAMEKITNDYLKGLEALTPDRGAYLNEVDVTQPDWQRLFYGSHYARLQGVKDRCNPYGVFFAKTAVGNER